MNDKLNNSSDIYRQDNSISNKTWKKEMERKNP